MQDLQRYSWPGNVRELQHVLERACIISERGKLSFEHLQDSTSTGKPLAALQAEERILTDAELRELKARNIRAALKRTNGRIYGEAGAAAMLGMKTTTLASRIKSLGI